MKKENRDDIELKIMEAFTSVKSDKEIGMPDIEKEFSTITAKQNKSSQNSLRKIAAVAAIIIAISCIAVAAIINRKTIVNIFSNRNKIEISRDAFTIVQDDALAVPTDTTLAKSRMIAFENAELCEIMDSINNVYNTNVVFKNEDIKHLHLHFCFNTDEKLNDVIISLNMFEKINIRLKDKKLEVE